VTTILKPTNLYRTVYEEKDDEGRRETASEHAAAKIDAEISEVEDYDIEEHAGASGTGIFVGTTAATGRAVGIGTAEAYVGQG